MRFDGVDDGLRLPDGLREQDDYTIFIVDQYWGVVQGRTLQSRESNWLIGRHGGQPRYHPDAWVYQPNMYAGVNVPLMGTAVRTGGNQNSYYVNGTLVGTATGPAGDPLRMGLVGEGLYNEQSQADVSEVLVYRGALTDSQRQAVERYLRAKWLDNQAAFAGNDITVNGNSTIEVQGLPGAQVGAIALADGATLNVQGDLPGQYIDAAGGITIDDGQPTDSATVNTNTADLKISAGMVAGTPTLVKNGSESLFVAGNTDGSVLGNASLTVAAGELVIEGKTGAATAPAALGGVDDGLAVWLDASRSKHLCHVGQQHHPVAGQERPGQSRLADQPGQLSQLRHPRRQDVRPPERRRRRRRRARLAGFPVHRPGLHDHCRRSVLQFRPPGTPAAGPRPQLADRPLCRPAGRPLCGRLGLPGPRKYIARGPCRFVADRRAADQCRRGPIGQPEPLLRGGARVQRD